MLKHVIYKFLHENRLSYLAGFTLMIVSSYLQTLEPAILGQIIDTLAVSGWVKADVYTYIGLMLLVAAGAFGTKYIWRYLVMGNGRKMECYLRVQLFMHLQQMTVEFYNRRSTGELMAYAINDVGAIRMIFGTGVAMIINNLGLITAAIWAMVNTVGFTLTAICLLPMPAIVFLLVLLGRVIQVRFRQVQEIFGLITGKVQENIGGLRVIKAYAQESEEVANFALLNAKMQDANIRMTRVSTLLEPVISICFGISFMITLIYGSALVKAGSISLGGFVAFNGYLLLLMRPVVATGRIVNIFQRGIASLKRLDKVFAIVPEIEDVTPNNNEQGIGGSIEIRNLSFQYPESPTYVLRDINITLPQGQVLGIIGPTGSGKTTIVNILLKLYNVQNGKVFIDGKDINSYSLEELRENIGFVPQDNFLFSAKIRDNISFDDDYSDEEIETATKISGIFDSIMSFRNKFETLVGERGMNLSGGQKQRLSIARAIIKDPAILIMDDALSAVDAKTEVSILGNLRNFMSKRTAIIISHRISSLKHADKIIVMDQGQIVEQGTHSSLLQNKQFYYRIYQEQSSGEEELMTDNEG
ncbi:MAG: ATPase [Sporomusa sp.]|nr:ATPase [Sporomusa sp.]